MATAPDPTRVHPISGQERVAFLKPLVTDPKIEVLTWSGSQMARAPSEEPEGLAYGGKAP